ncbi:MAG: hypothetical protein EOO24_49215, partial [Comamonadaceae bacterium]
MLKVRRLGLAALALLAVAPAALAQATGGQLPLVIGTGAGGNSYSVPVQTLLFFTALSFLPAEVKADTAPMRVLIPAFATSELKSAFQIGFMIFIPFLVIDIVVSSILMSLGMMMLSPVLVALP